MKKPWRQLEIFVCNIIEILFILIRFLFDILVLMIDQPVSAPNGTGLIGILVEKTPRSFGTFVSFHISSLITWPQKRPWLSFFKRQSYPGIVSLSITSHRIFRKFQQLFRPFPLMSRLVFFRQVVRYGFPHGTASDDYHICTFNQKYFLLRMRFFVLFHLKSLPRRDS